MADGWTVPGFTHVRELGHGASGRVVLAVDDLTRTPVALKYLDQALVDDSRFMAGFREQAHRLSQLEDPNMVDFYDFVESPMGGAAAIVMQRIDGVGLDRVLASQGPTGPPAALAVLGGSLAGLAGAHAAGVVHRDFNPANVLIDVDGNSLITDFGVTLEDRHGVPGTPAYTAPELWGGVPASPASDFYAATVVFFECLTGSPPYTSRSSSALARAHRGDAIPVEAAPGPLRGLIARGMAKDPADRPASAEEFLESLEEAAVAAYGPAWEVQGRSRLAEIVFTAAHPPPPTPSAHPFAPMEQAPQPQPPEPRPPRRTGYVPGGHAAPPAPRRGGRRARTGLVAGIAGAAVLVAGGAVAYGVSKGGDEPRHSTTAARSAKPEPSATPPVKRPKPLSAAALAARITKATGRKKAATFVHRRTGRTTVTARGSLQIAAGTSTSYDMTVASPGSTLRQPLRTVLVGGTAYVRTAGWRPVPAQANPPPGDPARGYAALAAGVRWSSSMHNVTALLQNSTALHRSGAGYRGTVALSKMSRVPAVAPLYQDLAKVPGARSVSFVIEVDAAGLPLRMRMTVKSQVLETTYSGWGRRAPITVPR